ncbi:hypothetical protein L1987_02533 [Smallanthus sonchifolius]|uniref:Uncharacterized protein n=1 Tax=Smallanthus sonchifolius TaxID=185202 RepID=A0ACB9K849_9ASTR|nr:hypothetical protein L1987_02533 [Smallanthus sonchifolius]
MVSSPKGLLLRFHLLFADRLFGDAVVYSKLKCFSSPLHVYPEQLLVKLGLSVLWDPAFVPLLTLDGKEGRRELKKGETNALVINKFVRYESGAYVGVSEVASMKRVKGKGKNPASAPNTKKGKTHLRSSKRLATSGSRASASQSPDPIDVSDDDDDFLAGCTGSVPSTVKLEPLDGESDNGGLDASGRRKPELVPEEASDVYVPDWSVKNCNSVKSHVVFQEMVYNFATPADRDALRNDSDEALIGRILVNVARNFTSIFESVDRLSDREKQLVEELNAARKQYDVVSEKLSSLKQSLVDEKTKMDVERVALDSERAVVQAEKEALDAAVEELQANQPLKPISECNNYHPKAEQESVEAIQQMEQLTYPYVNKLSKYFDRPLSELQALEPQGLKREAAESVLKPLGSKRSRDDDDVSKSVASVSQGGKSQGGKVRQIKKSRTDSASEAKTQASIGLQVVDTPDKTVAASSEESVGTGPKPDVVEPEKGGDPSV